MAGLPPFEYPSHTTIRSFIMRLGLYLLLNVSRRRDWIWIADHSYSIGTVKVFVVLGIRLQDFQQLDRPLRHNDMTVLELCTVEQSNGSVVQAQFEALATKYGEPLSILCDAGSDLKLGTRLFQENYPSTISSYDIVHLVSRKVEKIMNSTEQWDEFRKACCTCANAVRQSKLAHLKPPCPRAKARYMKFGREIRWAARALWLLDRVQLGNLTEQQKKRLPLKEVKDKLGWLEGYRSLIGNWEQISLTSDRVIGEVRKRGYGIGTLPALEQIAQAQTNETCLSLVNDVMTEITPTCHAASKYARIPASSEIIESLFGKAKHLLAAGRTPTNSFTGLLLSMVACTANVTSELINDAVNSVSVKILNGWLKENFTPSIHHVRREDLTATPTEQIMRKPKPAAIPSF